MRHRSAVLALVLAVGFLITGCESEIAGPKDQSETFTEKTLHRGPAGEAELAQELNAVRQATKKYRNVESAREDGYVAISPYVPGMGFHFAAGSPFGADEPENPGVLVYYTNGSYNPAPGEMHVSAHDDDLILGAVEYLVPCDQEANPPNIFNDEDSPRNLKVTEEEGWHFEEEEIPGVDCEGKVGFTGLHAWVHRGNPAGVFHSTNPTIDPQTDGHH